MPPREVILVGIDGVNDKGIKLAFCLTLLQFWNPRACLLQTKITTKCFPNESPRRKRQKMEKTMCTRLGWMVPSIFPRDDMRMVLILTDV